MYLFDPNEGNRRRSLIRDKATSMNNKTQTAIGGRVRDLSNRAKGMLHESKSKFNSGGQEPASGQTSAGADSFANRESYNH